MMKTRQYLKMAAQNIVLPVCYRVFCLFPIRKGLILFADAHHSDRPPSMVSLHERLSREGIYEIRELYTDYQRESFFHVLMEMIRFMYLYARAQAVILCDNFLPAASCRKRPGTMVLQLWHACGAFKKFGYDTKDDIPEGYHGDVFRNTDYVTVSSEACIGPFSSAMGLSPEKILPLGVCRTDEILDEGWRQRMRARFLELHPDAAGKKIALYAPTFRGNAASPTVPLPDLGMLQNRLGEEWMVLACLHPHMRQLIDRRFAAVQGTGDLLPVADVLITDYSSVIFEYLLFGRPLVLYTPDYEEYLQKRGFYLDFSEIPASWIRDERDLASACLEARPVDAEAFLRRYMQNCDGSATERVAGLIGRAL